jgi:hypothetical protein
MKLNRAAVQYARSLIRSGRVVKDERDAWSEHQPSTAEENEFIRRHGFAMYSKWHLGIDEEKDPETKAHYKFPYGDFSKAHRCAILTAESRAGQYKHFDIEKAAASLHSLIDGTKHPDRIRRRSHAHA